jgi:hypothetical protein
MPPAFNPTLPVPYLALMRPLFGLDHQAPGASLTAPALSQLTCRVSHTQESSLLLGGTSCVAGSSHSSVRPLPREGDLHRYLVEFDFRYNTRKALALKAGEVSASRTGNLQLSQASYFRQPSFRVGACAVELFLDFSARDSPFLFAISFSGIGN